MKRAVCLLLIALVLAVARPASAHEIGKTQVRASFHDGRYQFEIVVDPDALLTKLEVYGGERVSSNLSRVDRDRRIDALASVFVERVQIRFDGVLAHPLFTYVPASAFSDLAKAPSIVNLTGSMTTGAREVAFADQLAMGSYALNVRIDDGAVQTFWLDGPVASAPISLIAPPPPPTWRQIVWQYLGLGYTHILPKGTDHILFVLGIFLLSARWRSIVAQVSAFTLAHSITLGLTMYGIVSLPARVVEPMIALSIAYVAVENLFTSELKSWRLALVFSFGLLHGMGFAGVLKDLGLPRSQFLTALVTFNLGVEGGQLTVVAIAFACVAYWRTVGIRQLRALRLWISALRLPQIVNEQAVDRGFSKAMSLALALIGLYWTVQRLR